MSEPTLEERYEAFCLKWCPERLGVRQLFEIDLKLLLGAVELAARAEAVVKLNRWEKAERVL